MHQADRQPSLLTEIQFGFGVDTLYLRLDSDGPIRELFARGLEFSLNFLNPDGVRVSVRAGASAGTTAEVAAVVWERRAGTAEWSRRPGAGVVAAAGTILELGVPLTVLGALDGGQAVSFFVTVVDARGSERARYPSHRPIETSVPDGRFEAINWTA